MTSKSLKKTTIYVQGNFVLSVSKLTMKRTLPIATIARIGFALSVKEFAFALDVSDRIQ